MSKSRAEGGQTIKDSKFDIREIMERVGSVTPEQKQAFLDKIDERSRRRFEEGVVRGLEKLVLLDNLSDEEIEEVKKLARANVHVLGFHKLSEPIDALFRLTGNSRYDLGMTEEE